LVREQTKIGFTRSLALDDIMDGMVRRVAHADSNIEGAGGVVGVPRGSLELMSGMKRRRRRNDDEWLGMEEKKWVHRASMR